MGTMRSRRRRRGYRPIWTEVSPADDAVVTTNAAIEAHVMQGNEKIMTCKPGAPDNALERVTGRRDAQTLAVRVILEGSSVTGLCAERKSLDSPSASVSPDGTVTSLSDLDDDDVAVGSIPDTSLCDTFEDDTCTDAPNRCDGDNELVPQQCQEVPAHTNEERRSDAALETSSRESQSHAPSCTSFRINYLIVMTAIMLADGLQGTHLYVLYEGYGYSVASLYCLGFLTGAVASPITGPLVDRFGRKKSALAYCVLEIAINQLEQYSYLPGLIVSRMVGGVTTNLLSTVFETWLDTEYRRRGFKKSDYEIIMRDSVIVSNLAAIASGYLAHLLASSLGPKGPFQGAVTCTAIALGVVMVVWTENYGSAEPGMKTARGHLHDAMQTFKSDSRVLRVGLIHGLTTGAIQIFIFLWSPTLRAFAKGAPPNVLGIDGQGEPAYGLIFGSFMTCGVIGGLCATWLRKLVTLLLSPLSKLKNDTIEVEGEGEVRPIAVEFLAASCYIVCSILLLTPCIVSNEGSSSFSCCLAAFLLYELLIGIYMPTAGVIRSIYLPSDSRCSLLTMPQVMVNVAVSMGVASTNVVSLQTAFASVSFLMMTAAILQLTLVSAREWSSFFGRVDRAQKTMRRLSSNTREAICSTLDPRRAKLRRCESAPSTYASWSCSSETSSFKSDSMKFAKE